MSLPPGLTAEPCTVCGAPALRRYATPDISAPHCERARCASATAIAVECFLDLAKSIGAMFYAPRYVPPRGKHKTGIRADLPPRRPVERRLTTRRHRPSFNRPSALKRGIEA